MVLLALAAGISGGLYNSFVRAFLSQFHNPNSLHMFSTYLYALLSVSGAIFKLILVNKSMETYD
jgi:hypothetical protein